jgi:hypothetical protein
VRGFSSGRPRTSLPRPGFGTGDAVLVAAGLALLAAAIALRMAGLGILRPR